MNSFQDFLATAHEYRHHALLFVSRQFENSSFPDLCFLELIKNTCNILIHPNQNADVFEAARNHSDVFIADRTRKILRIEDLAKIKELVLYQPNQGKRRLILIENCERMNTNSANALLKSLEEPSANTLFIMTTRNVNLVPPTVASRCQKIFIHFKEIEKNCIKSEIAPSDFNFIKEQINSFCMTNRIFNKDLSESKNNSIHFSNLKKIIETSEKLAKEYHANTLQNTIVFLTNERLKKEPKFLTVSKFILGNISEWKKFESLNPSTQLWLIRIFTVFTQSIKY